MNTQSLEGQRTVFYPAVWQPMFEVELQLLDFGRSLKTNAGEILRHPHACGFMPAYDSIEALRRDYPSAEYIEFTVHKGDLERPISPRLIISENTVDLPRIPDTHLEGN